MLSLWSLGIPVGLKDVAARDRASQLLHIIDDDPSSIFTPSSSSSRHHRRLPAHVQDQELPRIRLLHRDK